MIMFNDMRVETFQYAIRLLAKPTASYPFGKIFNCTFNNLYSNSYTGKDIVASGTNAFYDNTFNDAHLDGNIDLSAVSNSGYDTPTFNLINCVPDETGGIMPPSAGPYRVVGDGIRIKTEFAQIVNITTSNQPIAHGLKLGNAHPMIPSCVTVTPTSSGITELSIGPCDDTYVRVNCSPGGQVLVHAWLNFPNP
jgi:hypothetical protein